MKNRARKAFYTSITFSKYAAELNVQRVNGKHEARLQICQTSRATTGIITPIRDSTDSITDAKNSAAHTCVYAAISPRGHAVHIQLPEVTRCFEYSPFKRHVLNAPGRHVAMPLVNMHLAAPSTLPRDIEQRTLHSLRMPRGLPATSKHHRLFPSFTGLDDCASFFLL
jgi:hypothetical protein